MRNVILAIVATLVLLSISFGAGYSVGIRQEGYNAQTEQEIHTMYHMLIGE